jgi:hypothetical protein
MGKPLVKITWNDTQDMNESWVDEATVSAFGQIDCEIVSVGWLVSKGPKYYTLAGDYHEDNNDYGRITKIAAGMVTKVEDLVVSPEKPQPE